MNREVELEKLILAARNHYYNGQSQVSDATYDQWIDELKALNPNNKAIIMIGAVPVSEWKKGKHSIDMGSLEKVSTPEELAKWINDTLDNEHSIFYSDKIDGLSIEVIYEDGRLIEAISRGDGTTGDCITPNVIKMHGVKKQLPVSFTGSLRGEIVLTSSNFAKHFQEYSNSRNAASGLSRRYDGEGSEYLDIFFYQAIGDREFLTEFAQLQFIKEVLGLQTPNYKECVGNNAEKLAFIIDEYNRYNNGYRNSLEYIIDGLVVKANDLNYQHSLGSKHMRDVGATAFKFPSEEAKTKITNIFVQVGNNSRLTPVVEVEPVELAGAKISRASIYNFGYINDMKLDIGAEVMIARRGDIIPAVASVIKATGTVFKMPKVCPSCNGKVEMHGEHLMCVNVDGCPAQIKGRISNWISGLNVLEVGDGLIDKLVEAGLVATPADLYKLTLDDLAGLERMGKKSAENVYKSLWSITEIPLDTFLGSLSIPIVAKSSIKFVMNAGYDTLDKILNATQDGLQAVKGLGPIKARSLFDGLRKNKKIIEELLELGVKVKTISNSGKLNGMVITITGKTSIKRDDLAVMIEEAGGKYAKSIGKISTHLVCASEDSTSSKANKARSAGVKIMSEDELLEMIEG